MSGARVGLKFRRVFLLVLAACLASLHCDDASARGGKGGSRGGGRPAGHVRHSVVGVGGMFVFNPFWGGFQPYPINPDDLEIVYIEQPKTPINPWYYCTEANGYYPEVDRCPGGWILVTPPPTVPASQDKPNAPDASSPPQP